MKYYKPPNPAFYISDERVNNLSVLFRRSNDKMSPFIATLVAFIALAISSQAKDLLFFSEDGSCNTNVLHMQCGNVPSGTCCDSAAPFCQLLFCNGCSQGDYLFSYFSATCSNSNYGFCVEPGSGSYCCESLRGGSACAAKYSGSATKRSNTIAAEDKNHNVSQSNITIVDGIIDPDSCERRLQPNKMVFFDDSGERHEIYLPQGTFQRAVELSQAKNWDELSNFSIYGKSNRIIRYVNYRSTDFEQKAGQGYEDWD
jgi:hypothetical protein